MGYVPTHGPSCYKVRAYPLNCRYCGKQVVYFECSCGSMVYFEPGDSGVEHDCGHGTKGQGVQLQDLDKSHMVVCDQCGIRVRGDRLLAHVRDKCPGGGRKVKTRLRLV